MAKLNDLTGLKFSYLYVESISNQRQDKKILWNCICKCGNKLLIKGNSLKTGNTQSCGCKKSESTIKRNKQNSKPRLNIEHCQHCNDELNDLNWWKSWKISHTTICIPCGRKINKEWDTKDKAKDRKLRNTFGINLKDYNAMLETQNNKCAICGTNNPQGKGSFHVDHCHTTNKIRGLLCHHCNHGLGNFKDNVNSLINAAKYLEK